jgi:hypothetical protein
VYICPSVCFPTRQPLFEHVDEVTHDGVFVAIRWLVRHIYSCLDVKNDTEMLTVGPR